MRRLAIAFVVLGLPVAPSQALAQGSEEDAFVNPDSPAGHEYAIPLESARKRGSAGGEKSARGGNVRGGASRSSAPLFGEGVGPSGSATSGREARPGKTRGSDSGPPDASRGDSAEDADRDSAGSRSTDPDTALGPRGQRGDYASLGMSSPAPVNDTWDPLSSPWGIGAALIVLLLGALAGVLGRKLRRGST